MATSSNILDNPNNISLRFSKMHGLGNDFVMIADSELDLLATAYSKYAAAQGEGLDARSLLDGAAIQKLCSNLALTLCQRNFAIGADGIIVAIDLTKLYQQSTYNAFYRALEEFTSTYPGRDGCDLAWIYVNSDGSYSQMCGNGLRCFTLFVQELGWLNRAGCSIATQAYPVTVTIKDFKANNTSTAPGGDPKTGGSSSSIEVISRLAGPKFALEDIPLDTTQVPSGLNEFVDQPIEINGLKLQATCVSMGNPHCVIFEQDGINLDRYALDIKAAHASGQPLKNFPDELVNLAANIQGLSLFPEGANIEFVKIDAEAPDTAVAFIVERGCGPTLACASGAAAVLAAGVKSGRLNKKSYVILPGGKLEVSLSSVTEQDCMREYIDLTGPAVKVFSGDVSVSASALLSPLVQATSDASASGKAANSSTQSGEELCV